jgi:alpha-L-arabinofuranosidase
LRLPTLDTLNRHAGKVARANIAQLVNCIQSLSLAHEDRFLLTPTYHVFALCAPHQDARALRTVTSAPSVHWLDGEQREHSLWGLNGSASVRGDALNLAVTDPHLTERRDADIAYAARRWARCGRPRSPHAA